MPPMPYYPGSAVTCDCGNLDAYWHGDPHGYRRFCCDGCWNAAADCPAPGILSRVLDWVAPRPRMMASAPAVVLTLTARQSAAVSAGLALLASGGTLRPEDVHAIASADGMVTPLSNAEVHALLARVEGRSA